MSDHILYSLETLSQTSNGRFLLEGSSGWAVLHSYPRPQTALCEVASNRYLPEENHLDSNQEKLLLGKGYTWRRGERSLGKIVPISTPEERLQLYSELKALFSTVYAQNIDEAIVSLSPNHHSGLNNTAFTKLMRDLSTKRTHDLRLQLYRDFLNATFLLAIDKQNKPRQVDQLASLPCFAVFTDDKSIRCWDPRGCLWKQCYGFEVIRTIFPFDAGSLLINPKGDISGELYKNELQTLAGAIRLSKS